METLIIVAIITLCISNLAITAMLALFAYTYIKPLKTPLCKNLRVPVMGDAASPPSDAISAEERERFQKEMEAFQELMSYNTDVAYGIMPKGKE